MLHHPARSSSCAIEALLRARASSKGHGTVFGWRTEKKNIAFAFNLYGQTGSLARPDYLPAIFLVSIRNSPAA